MAALALVPDMPSVTNLIGLAPPSALHAPCTYSELGKRVIYCATIHGLVNSATPSETQDILGQAVSNVLRAERTQQLEAGGMNQNQAAPGGFTAQDRAMLQSLCVSITGLTNDFNVMRNDVNVMRNDVNTLAVTSSRQQALLDNLEARRSNSRTDALTSARPLKPLFCTITNSLNFGLPSPLFPPLMSDVNSLTGPVLNTLAAFYGEAFPGHSVADRRIAFRDWIGV